MENSRSELEALREHVLAINRQMLAKGFTMASDTKLRLGQVDTLLAQEERLAGSSAGQEAWVNEAAALAAMLRIEAGQGHVMSQAAPTA